MVKIIENQDYDKNRVEDELSDEETEDQKLVKSLSASVRCPICLEAIAVTKAVNYFLLSNFFKHIRHHVKEKNQSAPKRILREKNSASSSTSTSMKVTKTSKKTKVENVKQNPVKGARSRKRKLPSKRENEANSESSDSDENTKLQKEMDKNFENQSDDDFDEETQDDEDTDNGND